MSGLRDSPLCASVGRISEAPSDTVKYLPIIINILCCRVVGESHKRTLPNVFSYVLKA